VVVRAAAVPLTRKSSITYPEGRGSERELIGVAIRGLVALPGGLSANLSFPETE